MTFKLLPRRTSFAVLLSLSSAFLTACAVGPAYVRPEPAAPAEWSQTVTKASRDSSALREWWKSFGDAKLNELIERAAGSSLELKIAQARVREARALRAVAAGAELPRLTAGVEFDRTRRSGHNPNLPPGAPTVVNLFQTSFDASWEIDLFGGTKRAVEAADAELGASVEDLRAAYVTLFGEIARNYVEVRGFQRRLAVARRNLEGQKETLAVTRSRLEAGLAPDFDVDRASAQVSTIEAQIPPLEVSLQRAVHRLAVLLGQEPGSLNELLLDEAPIPAPPPELQVGLPSDLLERRPDVRRAERAVAAATARVGAATADLYPRFSLAGGFGFQSGRLEDLALASSRFWSFGPALRLPLFQGGRIRANIEVQNERQAQALLAYEKAFLSALEEVENALAAYGKEEARRRALVEAVAAHERAFATAGALYSSGLTDFLQVLDAQRSLLAAQSQLAESEAAAVSGLVALYKALGGGWEQQAPAAGRPAEVVRSSQE
ncbi:MAG: efflux transporter outer membrane subunit [Deltaproteobacteria bacterium]|nr:efflux transporter outer membrane subunit [Deltaproteobacteria bacterium]